MARVVNIHEAKTQFSKLVDEAASGHEVPDDFNQPLSARELALFER